MRAHQSRGIVPKQQTLAKPRCPVTGRLIPDCAGHHIIAKNRETGATKSFYIHILALYPTGMVMSTVVVNKWLESIGYQ